MTDLEALRNRLDRVNRALDRAHALAESWDGSREPITRTQAAELLLQVIDLRGWDRTAPDPTADRRTALHVLPTLTEETR